MTRKELITLWLVSVFSLALAGPAAADETNSVEDFEEAMASFAEDDC